MITKPKLKPMPGMAEVEHKGRRMYRNIKTGDLVEPGNVKSAEEQAQAEFMERFQKTDEYALLEYLFMMEGVR